MAAWFLNRPISLCCWRNFYFGFATASLLFLFWKVPADTLDNASGGIIGYELGQSLSQILPFTVQPYFGRVTVVLRPWFRYQMEPYFQTLSKPAYLQDLFYRTYLKATVFDRTTPSVKKKIATAP